MLRKVGCLFHLSGDQRSQHILNHHYYAQTLYRHVAPGLDAAQGWAEVVEGGTIRYGKKKRKNDSATGLNPTRFPSNCYSDLMLRLSRAKLLHYFFTQERRSGVATSRAGGGNGGGSVTEANSDHSRSRGPELVL